MTQGASEVMWRRGARLIWRSLRAHPFPHAVAMFGATLFVFSAVGGAWVLRAVTDDVVVPAFEDGAVDRGDVWVAMLAIIGISLARGLSIVTRRWFLAMAEMRTQRDWPATCSATTSIFPCVSTAPSQPVSSSPTPTSTCRRPRWC